MSDADPTPNADPKSGSTVSRRPEWAVLAAASATVLLLGIWAVVRLVGASAPDEAQPAATPSAPHPFVGSARALTAQEAQWMTGRTWHEGCPVPIEDLRLLTVSYRDFGGAVAQGRIVVNAGVAGDVLTVFEDLYAAGFPLARVDTLELYPPGERPGRQRDVTVGFNCRAITGGDTWSQHAYGLAIDVNPLENPWVRENKVRPPAGRAFLDRALEAPGMIHADDAAVRAFASIGWDWGGDWTSLKDYMHFSASGT